MRKRTVLGLGLALCALGVHAQTPAPAMSAADGDTVFHFGKFKINTVSGDWYLSQGVTASSPAYDLKAGTVTVTGNPNAKPSEEPFSQIVADGSPETGMRVIGHFRQPVKSGTPVSGRPPLQVRAYETEADHAVYTPSKESADAGTLVLTGHPIVTVTDASQLAQPAPLTADIITITLGKDADGRIAVQDISGDNGQVTLTPLPPSKKIHADTQRP